jgi:hypothetical protein
VLILFSVVLATVVLPGTGLKRMVKEWLKISNRKVAKTDVDSLSLKKNLKLKHTIYSKKNKIMK